MKIYDRLWSLERSVVKMTLHSEGVEQSVISTTLHSKHVEQSVVKMTLRGTVRREINFKNRDKENKREMICPTHVGDGEISIFI